MNYNEEIKNRIFAKLNELNITDQTKRVNEELAEIYSKDESEYFINLADSKIKYENEHNLAIPYLLGICNSVNWQESYIYDIGDMPDIDVDYAPIVLDYMKTEYVPKTFGKEKICRIGTYTRFGIKSSLLDAARIFGLDHHEIQEITTSLPMKDEEGEILTWEAAVETDEELKKYLETYPELAKTAKKLLNRIRGTGVHAAGVIISSVNISEFVPLIRPKKGPMASAWSEGLSSSDLSAVGLVKFDFLGLDSGQTLAEACHYHEDILKLGKVAALENNTHFSNEDLYTKDPLSLKQSSIGDLRMIFQFDGSPSIRRLAKDARADCFEDLTALTAIFRPGPLKSKMDQKYCNRKFNTENWIDKTHESIYPIVNKTYGLMIYQETCMKILHEIGKIPKKDCEAVRKAISKKKIEKFKKYQDQFIKNGTKTLGNEEEAIRIWKEIEAFSAYSFCKSHAAAYTLISARQLYMKTNCPEAYIPAFLNNYSPTGEDGYKAMKDYLIDANKHGIICNRADINLSKAKFYPGNKLYYCFQKLKGIGEEAAKKIEQNQPYTNYPDFLDKFGTDAKVNSTLIMCRAIPGDPKQNWAYYENYKLWKKRNKDSNDKLLKAKEKILNKLKELNIECNINNPDELFELAKNKDIKKFINSYAKSLKKWVPISKEPKPILEEQKYLNDKFSKKLDDEMTCDKESYGFLWYHPIEKALGNSTEKTFDNLNENFKKIGNVHAILIEVNKKKSKNGNMYYSLTIEDANCVNKKVTIWENEYDRFKEILKKDNIIQIKLKKPDEKTKYFGYSLEQVGWKMPPKEQDFRIILIKEALPKVGPS